MTQVLLITNKGDITTDFVVKRLNERKIPFYRLNTEELGISLNFEFNLANESYQVIDQKLGHIIDLSEIKAVYFRRPELPNKLDGLSHAESQFVNGEISYSFEALYKILRSAVWLNTVTAIRNAENKFYQLEVAKKVGFTIPESILTNVGSSALTFYKSNDEKCIIKPIKTGWIATENSEEGLIFTSSLTLTEDQIDRISVCPVYLQRHIPKSADVRVTVVGKKIFGALIHSQEFEDSRVDWRNHQNKLRYSQLTLPDPLIQKCYQLLESLGLNFGALDFILTPEDDFVFLEINPNGQWAWIERLLDFDISGSIVDFLASKL